MGGLGVSPDTAADNPSATGAPSNPRRGCWEAVQDYTWTLELLSLVLAIASTAAICIILGLWDGCLLRDWPLPIQPNSLVSVFSTLAKTALALPVASVISQMKWVWFEEPRRLADLQTFDRASRGPWGALQLVWDTKGRAWITKAACILSIVALAYEPTAQQVLSFESRETPSNNATASLSIATNWTAASLQTDGDDFSKQVAVQSLLLSAFGSKAQNNSVPQFQCTAPTCHWQNVSTLGACSKCQGGPRPVSSLVRNGTNLFLARPPISDLPVGPATMTNASEFPTLALQPQVFRFDMDAPNGMHIPDYSLPEVRRGQLHRRRQRGAQQQQRLDLEAGRERRLLPVPDPPVRADLRGRHGPQRRVPGQQADGEVARAGRGCFQGARHGHPVPHRGGRRLRPGLVHQLLHRGRG
ncbi:hypothetical protein PG997_002230 [Apiospora hydei]|uniref:RanBP2-type domain-containing protein n=1 Tax=Apiospora hydei TaxID=1337664 RepID=A0ABR1X8R4_9PEZI